MDARSGLVYATSITVGKGTRFVTSFLNLEDKVIFRQVAKYLRKTFDSGAPRDEISGKSVAARRGGNKYSPIVRPRSLTAYLAQLQRLKFLI